MLLSVIRHNHFQSQANDFSIYDQALWLYSHFLTPYSTITGKLDLADRFRPIMLTLSTIYWLTNNERILYFVQSLALSAAIFPIWFLAKRHLGKILALVVSFLFIDFIGIQAIAAYDFHELALLPFLLAFLFLTIDKEKWAFYFVLLVLVLSVREYLGFFLVFVGVYVWYAKRNLKVALSTSVFPLLWSLVAIRFVMPFLGQSSYQSFLIEGDTIFSAILDYLKSPGLALYNFFLPLEKTKTLAISFLSFGFLPFLYLPMSPAVVFHLASRFLDQLHPIRWTPFYQYNGELAVMLSVSTIFSIKYLSSRLSKTTLYLVIILSLVGHSAVNLIQDSPLKNLLKPSFYLEQAWMENIRSILPLIPNTASVASQNNLVPHLSHRREVYVLPEIGDADYILVDLHQGQNQWNFYTLTEESLKNLVNDLLRTKQYKIKAVSDQALLLEKI